MGGGIALLVWSRLGLAPMDVLHAGVSHATGWTFGSGIIVCQLVLATTFIPLRLKPGVGTVAAFVVPAVVADGALQLLPTVDAVPIRIAAFAAGGAPLRRWCRRLPGGQFGEAAARRSDDGLRRPAR